METKPLDETQKPEITIEIPSVEREIQRVQHYVATFEAISLLTKDITLPEALDPSQTWTPEQVEDIVREEYSYDFYLKGRERLQGAVPVVQNAVSLLAQFQKPWGFQAEKSYEVLLTRYGTGGSYNTEGKNYIRMRTTADGSFVRENPAATPIHEITHLCVQHLVQKYGLTFAEKEDLVKSIDEILFPDIFDPEGNIPEEERARLRTMLFDLPKVIERKKLTSKPHP